MFKGYTKIKESHTKHSEYKFGFNYHAINSPLLKWEEYVPLPFEDNYNFTYKKKFLSKLNGPNFNKLISIQKISPNKKKIHITSKKENTFITTSKEGAEKRNVEILQKIFPNGEDKMKNFSSLHFFSIDKNPLEIDYPSYNSTKTSVREPFVEAEFYIKYHSLLKRKIIL